MREDKIHIKVKLFGENIAENKKQEITCLLFEITCPMKIRVCENTESLISESTTLRGFAFKSQLPRRNIILQE